MQRKPGVSVSLLRGQSLKLPPPLQASGVLRGVGAGLPARVRSQTGRQGQLAEVVRDPRHQAHKSPNPAFCGPGAEKLRAGRREIQVPTLRVRQELAVWP